MPGVCASRRSRPAPRRSSAHASRVIITLTKFATISKTRRIRRSSLFRNVRRLVSELGMNERAWAIANRYAARAYDLRMGLQTLSSGARVIDAGVNVPGGLEAGTMLVELCMGGLGHVAYVPLTIGGDSWSGVQVWTDHPAASCMASQYRLGHQPEGFFAMGSGTASRRGAGREGTVRETRLYRRCLTWRAGAGGRTPPTDDVAAWVARKANVPPNGITFAIAPTASLAGGVQIVARTYRDRSPQDGHAGVRRHESRKRDRHCAAPACREERPPAIGRTNDCVFMRPGALHDLWRRRGWRNSLSACHPRHLPTTARRSMTSSSVQQRLL